ncbi:sensor histidine kinase [Dyadobacter subterraneus]|uniref:histidine kinase n=1 Tax=Dyadobacter subterraneus TaxID=2773304 RepID=A0ABR9W8I9_9BACT|nr:HAMP domain-containing sensor histidine kinase [Dyadobacter subterraneus]MBE9461787.1 HAMP domain-containing histidine kinase [Dyadobacter subterraneus]
MEQQQDNHADSPPTETSLHTGIEELNKEIEAYQLKVAELSKLADIGQLSAGILHEIKNPVSFVNNFSRLSQGLVEELAEILEKPAEELSDDDKADQKDLLDALSKNLVKINENGKRIERIIQGMLLQTRTDGAFLEPTDLNQLLEEFSKLAYQGARAEDKDFNVTLKYDLDPLVKEVKISRGDFGRVILNLVNNACYAVNERAKRENVGYNPCIKITTKKRDDKIEIRFEDNGIGIPADIVSKLFQPFFTTKPHGKGTGLGLSLTYSTIVETHQGTIEVTSELNEKTEFLIVIPA